MRHRSSHSLLGHLACLLPILVLLVLAAFEVRLPLLLLPVGMLLCCLAMAYLMADACSHNHHRPAPDRVPESPPAPDAPEAMTDDVFRVERVRRVGGATVLEGELLGEPGEVYETLKRRYEGSGTVPLLQEGADGRPVVVLVPRGAESGDAAAPGPWVPVLLLVATLATTTWAGAAHAGADLLREPGRFAAGLPYALALLLILGVHESGHYLAARAHGMRVSPPYFIPVPFAWGRSGRSSSSARPRRTAGRCSTSRRPVRWRGWPSPSPHSGSGCNTRRSCPRRGRAGTPGAWTSARRCSWR